MICSSLNRLRFIAASLQGRTLPKIGGVFGAQVSFFKRLLKGLQHVLRVVVTDRLRRYGVVQRALLPDVEHRQSRYLNNRAKNSHRPTRRRERQTQRFKSAALHSQPKLGLARLTRLIQREGADAAV